MSIGHRKTYLDGPTILDWAKETFKDVRVFHAGLVGVQQRKELDALNDTLFAANKYKADWYHSGDPNAPPAVTKQVAFAADYMEQLHTVRAGPMQRRPRAC